MERRIAVAVAKSRLTDHLKYIDEVLARPLPHPVDAFEYGRLLGVLEVLKINLGTTLDTLDEAGEEEEAGAPDYLDDPHWT